MPADQLIFGAAIIGLPQPMPPTPGAAGDTEGIVHMPAVEEIAGVLVELAIGVPVFIMLFGL